MTTARARLHSDALLERGLVFVLAASLGGLALALAGQFHAWWVLLAASAATFAYDLRVADSPASPLALRGTHVAIVLLVALLFRIPPYQYVLGGQDPGVYTNIAAHIVHTGGVSVRDREAGRLAGTSAMDEYRRQNQVRPFVPGVYLGQEPDPGLTFQFYHLFPVWLALAGSLFGLGASGAGLLFLSLVSILFFQRLAAEISASRSVGLAAGLLLAANPLHAFFSKFPVTEVPTLAFSTAGFCLLAMYALAAPAQRRRRSLWLSACCFACLFLTRISGFMYLPLVLALSVAALARDTDRERAIALSGWSLAVALAYALSVAYGLAWSHRYAMDVYEDAFAPLLGAHWDTALAVITTGVAFAWLAAWRLRNGHGLGRLGEWIGRLDRWMGPALLMLLPIAAIKAWQLGFTTHYVGNPVLEQFPGVVASGWHSVAHASLVVAAVYLGPLALVALLGVAQARLPPAGRFLLFFVCGFMAYAACLNWVVPYQPYYARYLLSELVPYGLLLVCCALAWLASVRARRALAGALLLSGASYLVMSGSQVGKQDNAGALASIGELASRVGGDDVLLLDGLAVPGFDPQQVKTTLLYTFDRHVVTVGSESLTDYGFIAGVQGAYDRVLLLSTRGPAPPGYTELAPVRVRVKGFRRSSLPPHRLEPVMDANLHLFRLDELAFETGFRHEFPLDRPWPAPGPAGHRRPGQGILATGTAGEMLSGPGIELPAGRYRLVLRGSPDGRGDGVLRVVDGQRLLAATALRPQATPGGALAWMDFDVPDGGARRVGVQVRVGDGSRVLLRDYRLVRIG